MWFTDAAKTCGADLTRVCVEKFMNRQTAYGAHGLLVPDVGFNLGTAQYYHGTTHQCVSAAQWSNSAHRWITRATAANACYNARAYSFALTAPT
jgi:hypothetical protein